MRYYYKKDGRPAYNLKEPLEHVIPNAEGYIQITEEEWHQLEAETIHRNSEGE